MNLKAKYNWLVFRFYRWRLGEARGDLDVNMEAVKKYEKKCQDYKDRFFQLQKESKVNEN